MTDDPIRDALHMMHYGFYSITSRRGDEVNAMVANWITQASFSPRLIVFAVAKKARSHDLIIEGKVMGINIFKKANKDTILQFSRSSAKDPDKMEGAEYAEGPETGVPLLKGASAHIECRVKDVLDIGGDHTLIVAEPVSGQVVEEVDAADTMSVPDTGWSYAG